MERVFTDQDSMKQIDPPDVKSVIASMDNPFEGEDGATIFMPVIAKAFDDGFNLAVQALQELKHDAIPLLVAYLHGGFADARAAYLEHVRQLGK